MVTSANWTERNVDEARESILRYIQEGYNVIYVDGWNGFGAGPVIRSTAQVLPSIKSKKTPPDLCFDRIIYIDCSAWINERVMQRKIAEGLELNPETMAMFDKHDEDDDFRGVDSSSRGLIRRVSQVTAQTLSSSRVIMLFINGSDREVDMSKYGLSPNSLDHVVVWTFKRQLLTMRTSDGIEEKIRSTHLILQNIPSIHKFKFSEFRKLLNEEAAFMAAHNPCMQDMDLNMVSDCCLYYLFLHYCFHGTHRFYWATQAPNCWLCDGDIKGDITREISNALYAEINWDCDAPLLKKVFENFKKDPESPFLIIKDDNAYKRRPYKWIWISVTSKNLKVWEDMQTMLSTTSSFFAEFDNSSGPQKLPDRLFEHCSNLHVLSLSCCSFSFLSPPFLKCHKLRFLGLDRCTDNKTSNAGESTEWAFLHKLWVLEVHYTHWNEIISEEKMDIMFNLHELNIEEFCCWQHTCKLQGRLPNLQRLRIIRPTQQIEISIDSSKSFMDKTKMEILDLSGNRGMRDLPESLSKASSLQMLILDGCDGLENVIVPDRLPSSLRLFSLDGYGPAAPRWTSSFELPLESSRPKCAPDTSSMENFRISKISLQGCIKLENLFVRGLPNLEELDLSGTAIKKLDFRTMVVDVPKLKRVFLLGCEHLRHIGSSSDGSMRLDLICLDTRVGRSPIFTRPTSLAHKDCLYLHAIFADERLAWSLWSLMESYYEGGVHFNIHITSSTEYAGAIIEPEAVREEMIETNTRRHHGCLANRYDGVLTKIGDVPMLAFPEPPTQRLDRHIEFSDWSLGLDTESSMNGLADILKYFVQSMHVHDVMMSASMPLGSALKWFRVERCPNLDTIFGVEGPVYAYQLETIWVSNLLMARGICSKRFPVSDIDFRHLQHLHLRSCPRLQFVLPVLDDYTFPNLKTIHIIHCGDLRHVFVLAEGKDHTAGRVWLPKLTTIHLHDLPNLQKICEVKMLAPALETIRIRGCFGLRQLPAVAVRHPGQRRPTVEMEMDVWGALEWDRIVEKHPDMSMELGHHPDLFEPPVHCRYFKKRHIRGTVLR